MTDAIISIRSVQPDPGVPEQFEFITAGKYGFENGECRLIYEESDVTGLDGVRTTFNVSPERVVLKREGSLNTEMIFQEGQKNFFLYNTPFGSATMGIDTRSIDSTLGEHGGALVLDYAVDMNHTPLGKNKFTISVRESNYV